MNNRINLKRIGYVIWRIFVWTLYLMITAKERQKHQHAKYSRREVIDINNGLFGSTYFMGAKLNPNESPKRDFMTWKEYRQLHKF